MERAFNDILRSVKKNSFEYYRNRSGGDIMAVSMVVEGKKALEELGKTNISLK